MENLSAIFLKNVVDENKIFFPLFNSLLVDLTESKTESTLSERTTEHAWSSNDSGIKFHLDSCDAFNDILCIHNMSSSLFSDTRFSDAGSDNHRALRIDLVQNNTTIIDRHNNWNILLLKRPLK